MKRGNSPGTIGSDWVFDPDPVAVYFAGWG